MKTPAYDFRIQTNASKGGKAIFCPFIASSHRAHKLGMVGAVLAACLCASSLVAEITKPNIVFILADDAGIGDFSAYGCKYGTTPNIDRLAQEGMKFTQAYSGNAVCAPSRCVLMTGQHPGHAVFRANGEKAKHLPGEQGKLHLPGGQFTVAKLLHDAGYVTGGFGKWGLGNPGTAGVPEKLGFDVFFGYYDQVHAHDYFTDHLIRNSVDVPIRQSGKKTWEDYSATRIANETIQFIEQNKDHPFFLLCGLDTAARGLCYS